MNIRPKSLIGTPGVPKVRPVLPGSHPVGGLAPALAGALAVFRCRPWARYDGGDHLLQLGVVVGADVGETAEPLVFDRGRFTLVAA